MNDAAADQRKTHSQEEVELFRKHPSMFRNHPVGFVLTTLLLIGGIVGAFWSVWALIASVIALIIFAQWWLKCIGTILIVTNEGINVERGILSKSTNELWHTDVRNVQIVQTFAQRIMGVGTINISSSGQGEIEICVHGIPNPHEVHRIIENERRRLGNI